MSLKPIISTLIMHFNVNPIIESVTENKIVLWKWLTLSVDFLLCNLLQIKVLPNLY